MQILKNRATMGKFLVLGVLLINSVVGLASNKDKNEVGKLIKQSVAILKDMQQIQYNSFRDYYVDSTDIDEILKGEELQNNKPLKDRYEQSLYQRMEHVEQDYKALKSSAAEYNINWSQIKTLDAVYKKQPQLNAGVVVFFFTSGNEEYFVELKVVRVSEEYKYIQIESLQISEDDKIYREGAYGSLKDDQGYYFSKIE